MHRVTNQHTQQFYLYSPCQLIGFDLFLQQMPVALSEDCNSILVQYVINLKIGTMPSKHTIYLLIILAVVLPWSSASNPVTANKDNHYQLTTETLPQFISRHPYFMLYFHAPDCKQCITIDIEYGKLAKYNNNTNSSIHRYDVKLAKIDGSVSKQTAEKYGVTRYPALFYFDHTFVVRYRAGGTAKDIDQWIGQYMQDRIVNVNQLSDLNHKHKPYIVLEGNSVMESERDMVSKVLFERDDITAYYVKQSNQQSTKLTLHFKDSTITFTEPIERIALGKWISEHTRTSSAAMRTAKQTQDILFNQQKKPILVVFMPDLAMRHTKTYTDLLEACAQFKDKVICGQVFPKYESFKGLHGYFKVKNDSTPFIGLTKQQMNIAYRMDMDFAIINKKSLINFIEGALTDTIDRVVDNVAPTSTKFVHVKQVTLEQLNQTIESHKYVFANYYNGKEQASLFFSRPYEAFAGISKSEEEFKEVQFIAVDCEKHTEQCKKLKFAIYPEVRLYINGVAVPYEKTEKLPEVPELTRFLHQKISNKIETWKESKQSKQVLPYLVLTATEIPKKLQAIPAMFDNIKMYHKKSSEKQRKLELYTPEGNEQYEGEFKLSKIIAWVKQQTSSLLSDLLVENPDSRIIEAVKNKKPLAVIADAEEDRQQGKKYRFDFGYMCKKLDIACGYADSKHSAYPTFLGWLNLPSKKESRIVYIDLATDKKYLYPGSLKNLDADDFSTFMREIEKGGYHEPLSLSPNRPVQEQPEQQEQQEQPKEEVIVEQL